jgi:hypothetical protein
MPALCAAVSACAMPRPMRTALRDREGSFALEQHFEAVAFDVLHRDEVRAVVLVQIEDAANAGMGHAARQQDRERLGLRSTKGLEAMQTPLKRTRWRETHTRRISSHSIASR